GPSHLRRRRKLGLHVHGWVFTFTKRERDWLGPSALHSQGRRTAHPVNCGKTLENFPTCGVTFIAQLMDLHPEGRFVLSTMEKVQRYGLLQNVSTAQSTRPILLAIRTARRHCRQSLTVFPQVLMVQIDSPSSRRTNVLLAVNFNFQ
ncbi:hypothetical protein HAX54_048264, partial [Datura stramonium]|nr:hypothetical protein [Datura stramonium]